MKLPTLALTLLASTGLTTPLRRDTTHQLFTLRLSSPDPSLNNHCLTTSPETNTTLLLITTTSSFTTAPPIHFYALTNPTTNLSELRTVPLTSHSEGTTLALVGTNGLFDFASLADPTAVAAAAESEGGVCDWISFKLVDDEDGEGEDGDGDGDGEGVLRYAGKGEGGGGGRWVALPMGEGDGEWSVKWKDANAWMTANYMPVEVVYEVIKE